MPAGGGLLARALDQGGHSHSPSLSWPMGPRQMCQRARTVAQFPLCSLTSGIQGLGAHAYKEGLKHRKESYMSLPCPALRYRASPCVRA